MKKCNVFGDFGLVLSPGESLFLFRGTFAEEIGRAEVDGAGAVWAELGQFDDGEDLMAWHLAVAIIKERDGERYRHLKLEARRESKAQLPQAAMLTFPSFFHPPNL